MTSADNSCIFSEDKDRMTWMVNEINEELTDVDMQPKPESLWWTSTNKEEDERTLKAGSRGKSWDLPLVEAFDLLGFRFRRSGRRIQRTEKLSKGMGSWWRDGYIHRAKSVFFEQEM